ncbi:hypothetical protein GCM10010222_18710 [Streptomyces tanashiensis]|uniref:effector-associated domain EAD1-containing protein n=1 Tax=Streptomyces tanashiensis TaxID=67367 RepID=UPI001677C278|nr:effector-associated domain EAD1-containing protein [Streptomyces tanashiensis]GGS77671.1 hypothetical protein GCM10010222_18710 [Streptomyces tanashiensis]
MNILDQRVFPFGDDDGRELLAGLLNLYWRADGAVVVVQGAGLDPADYAWAASMADTWPRILERAATKGRLRALVTYVESDPNSAAFPVFGRLLRVPPQSTTDAFSLSLFGRTGSRALFDRATLRAHLKELTREEGGGVLILTGDDGCGKSYSWYFISHVLQGLGVSPVLVDCERWAGTPATPADVMRDICYQLDWPMRDPVVDEPEDTQARVQLAWFKGRVRAQGDGLWIFFDRPREKHLTPAAVSFVKEIAVVAERHEVGAGLRVVLADFHGPLRPEVEPSVLREPIAPIETCHLRAFLERVSAAAGQSVDEEAVTLLVEELLEHRPLPSPPPLGQLSSYAVKIARETFGLPEGFNG